MRTQSLAIIIPARAGSKGVPGKNLKKIGELSLLARAVRTALKLTENVYVSSDGEAILKEAEHFGARPIRRPKAISGDTAPSESAVLHALATLDELPQHTVLMQCTSPFTSERDLHKGLKMLRSGEFDSVFSGTEDHGFYWRYLTPDGRECVPIGQQTNYRPRRQELPRRVRETGSFYIMNTERFLNEKFRFFGRVGVVIESSKYVLDIDTPVDFELAKCVSTVLESR